MASRNAKGRMIYWKISYCKQLARCSLLAQLLFTWLIPNADDLGRLEGDPEIIKGMIFPYHQKITPKQIEEALKELNQEGLIIWYMVGENWYIQIPNFTLYQKLRKDREYSSDYPECDADMTCHDNSCRVGQNLREGEGKEKEKVSGSEIEGEEARVEKTKYADFVSLTNDEYSSLVTKLGEEGTKRCIEILDNYKGSTGKKYKSDYRTILNWVVQRYEDEQQRKKQQDKPSQTKQPPQATNFKQREYSPEFYEKLIGKK